MRLGFDLDGTVADLQGALAREAARLFPGVDPGTLPKSIAPQSGPVATDADTAAPGFSMSSLSPRQQRELWAAACARENFWETLDEIEPGSLARLYQLVRERRWEVIFLTSRPETRGDTAQVQSHRWLSAHGFELPSVYVVHGSRGKIAASLNLEVLVDDRPENCLDIAIDSSARAILVWRSSEDAVPASARQLGIGSVGSISECLDILETLDRSDSGAGIVDRFKQLLGLKRTPRRAPAQVQVSS
ncbi:MAG TPA: hypothetical protein VGD94_07545 [Vicinamibacterales bacterium]